MKAGCCGTRRAGGILSVLLPGAAWLAMPKCPACLAAYLAAFTGLGVSAGFAAGFRALVVFVTLAALFLFAARLLRNYQMTKP